MVHIDHHADADIKGRKAEKEKKKEEEASQRRKTSGGNRGHWMLCLQEPWGARQAPSKLGQFPGSLVDIARQAPLNKPPLT
jgi:hypothetical protein